ncbi:MAG TPA: HNH endonuclease, partial [Ilumatobacteraceae bacterium]|nr:HNH endonuclease [Ilumatobacteraceae bacterium]
VSYYGLQQGLTDIDNLVPLCGRHHHLVHEGSWKLHLAADRTLTITRPDGRISIHDPPRAGAA